MGNETKILSPIAQKLLNKLVADYCSHIREDERVFKKEDGAAYIHNLFVGNYEYSVKTYKEIFNYLCG